MESETKAEWKWIETTQTLKRSFNLPNQKIVGILEERNIGIANVDVEKV